MVVRKRSWLSIIYFVLGFYFINEPFNFIEIPGFISNLNSWIVFIGGFFMIVGGINYLRVSKNKY